MLCSSTAVSPVRETIDKLELCRSSIGTSLPCAEASINTLAPTGQPKQNSANMNTKSDLVTKWKQHSKWSPGYDENGAKMYWWRQMQGHVIKIKKIFFSWEPEYGQQIGYKYPY